MDNKINLRRSPEYGCFEFVPRKPAEASSLPVGNATNSAGAPARPVSPQIAPGESDMPQALNAKAKKQLLRESEASAFSVKKLKPDATLSPPADSDFDIEEGYHTPEDVKKSLPVLPGAPRFEYKDTDSGARTFPGNRCINLQKHFASLESHEDSPVASDSSQKPAESKKPH
ncbi:hypothetical protein F3I35_16025 [Pantoea sp. Bo_7]|uniref:hypothetical protein n=1 Tax=unclassified Pantoea TaxID=2630326 RepID=UPI0012324810|nr:MULTISPECIES: hypothetical protein [unclassified Pantoea]KAA6043279.1 hypothetical protein F3I35_16025 [Pantoea sp. Bo_7]KAA6088148.1 hypothetical protein F3I22_15870 [Pantoea sp. Bo_10]